MRFHFLVLVAPTEFVCFRVNEFTTASAGASADRFITASSLQNRVATKQTARTHAKDRTRCRNATKVIANQRPHTKTGDTTALFIGAQAVTPPPRPTHVTGRGRGTGRQRGYNWSECNAPKKFVFQKFPTTKAPTVLGSGTYLSCSIHRHCLNKW